MYGQQEEYPFSVDYFRCGKCRKEFIVFEEFVLHKLFVENCSLMLWESHKIQGLKLPRFLEKPINHKSDNGSKNIILSEKQNTSESTTNTVSLSQNNINDDFDPKMTDLLTFKHNNKTTQISEVNFEEHDGSLNETPKEKSDESSNDKKMKDRKLKQLHLSTKSQLVSGGLVCDQCGNRYKDIVVLRTHISTVHNDVRPYLCHNCSQTFKTKGSLVRHIRRHTDERPFHCNQCGRSFRESGALTRHLKSRVPCLTKADTDLPRYGKTMVLEDSECDGDRNAPSTLQIIISRVPEDGCNLKSSDKRKELYVEEAFR